MFTVMATIWKHAKANFAVYFAVCHCGMHTIQPAWEGCTAFVFAHTCGWHSCSCVTLKAIPTLFKFIITQHFPCISVFSISGVQDVVSSTYINFTIRTVFTNPSLHWQLYDPFVFLHSELATAPQGLTCAAHSFISVSHCVPLNPCAQLQLNPFTRSVQVPLFLQGWLAQSSTSVSHCVPLNPGAQLQLNPFTRSVQDPLFLHGWIAQSSISVLKDKIEKIKRQ